MERDILKLKINGVTPFLSHRDCVNDRLRQAHAMLLVLEQHYRIAADHAAANSQADDITATNPIILADAVEGIAAMIALAQHHEDCAAEERRRS